MHRRIGRTLDNGTLSNVPLFTVRLVRGVVLHRIKGLYFDSADYVADYGCLGTAYLYDSDGVHPVIVS